MGSNISKAKSNCSATFRRIENARIQAHPNDSRPNGWFSSTCSVQALLISSAVFCEPTKLVISVPKFSFCENNDGPRVRGRPDVPAQVSVGRQMAMRNRVCRIEDQCRAPFPANQICVWSHMTFSVSAKESVFKH